MNLLSKETEVLKYNSIDAEEDNDEFRCIEVTSTPKTDSSSLSLQKFSKSSNRSVLKSPNVNLKPNPKTALPVLSISRKEAVYPEIENQSISKITKTYRTRKSVSEENTSTLSEREKSNQISNLPEFSLVEVSDPNPTLQDVEINQEVENEDDEQDGNESDEVEVNDNFDNYVDVEAVSDGENASEAPENQEDTLSEIQLLKTATDATIDGPTKERRLACPNGCGNFFYIKSALQKHIRYNCGRVYPSQSFRYKCAYCDSRSEYSYSIMRHISKHHRMQKQRVIDTWLKEILEKKEAPKKKSKNDANDATSIEKRNVKQHQCPNKCGSFFDHVYNISRHIRKTCTKVQRYLCPYCKYRTRTFLLVKKHIEMNHRLNKVCAINVFTKQVVYKDIRRRGTISKKDMPASEKEGKAKSLIVQPGVSKAKESSEGRKKKQRFQCPNDCGFSFNYKHTLDHHIRFVCGKMRFKCPYCPKQCRQDWGAIIHIKHRHPGRKNFVIDILRKKVIYESGGIKHCNDFDSIQDLKTREEFEKSKSEAACVKQKNKLQAEPIFKCPQCSKLCRFAWNLSMHIKFRHPHVKNYKVQPTVPQNLKSENQRDVQESDLQEKDLQDTVEIESSFDEAGEFSEDTSEAGCFDILEDTKEILAPCLSSLASAELSLDSEAKDTSSEAESTFKRPKHGRRNFLCPNNCGSLIKYEHNLTRHLRNVCGKRRTLKCPHCQYRCKSSMNMTKHIKLLHARREAPVIDNDLSKELLNEADQVVVKREPIEVDSIPPE